MLYQDVNGCSLLTPWVDPVSGVKSFILSRRVAPVQQSFYFTNRSFTADGRYLWFTCAHPPGGNGTMGRTLGVADFVRESVVWFPETQFRDASPMVDLVTGEAYWCWDYTVYHRSPSPECGVTRVNSVPESVHRNRSGTASATHLTRSTDGREFFIDIQLGREWCVGSLPVDGSGFSVWQTFDRCYDHGQFSPTDPDLALIAQDWWYDVATGERHGYENRLWLIRRGQLAEPIFSGANTIGHEWWDPDGEHIWYVDYRKGTEKVHVASRRTTNVWPGGTWHSHTSADGTLLVGDIQTGGYRVAFFNAITGREINIVSMLSLPAGDTYHVHPHPQFCLDDAWVVYTTMVLGRPDVAMVRTDDLVKATA